jgi:hypothetical protein
LEEWRPDASCIHFPGQAFFDPLLRNAGPCPPELRGVLQEDSQDHGSVELVAILVVDPQRSLEMARFARDPESVEHHGTLVCGVLRISDPSYPYIHPLPPLGRLTLSKRASRRLFSPAESLRETRAYGQNVTSSPSEKLKPAGPPRGSRYQN